MPDPSQTLPDVLETLGMSITEGGAIQVGTDRALRAPSGEGRVTVVLQSAWSGSLEVQVTVKSPAEASVTRKVALGSSSLTVPGSSRSSSFAMRLLELWRHTNRPPETVLVPRGDAAPRISALEVEVDARPA